MTHGTSSGGIGQRTRRHGTAATEHSRNEERTADARRGTDSEAGDERAAREYRSKSDDGSLP